MLSYSFIWEVMWWCDIVFFLTREKLVSVLAFCFRNDLARRLIFTLFGAFLLGILAAAPFRMFLVAAALWITWILWDFLVALTGYCPSLPIPIENWLFRTLTSLWILLLDQRPLFQWVLSTQIALAILHYTFAISTHSACQFWGGIIGLILKSAAKGEGYYERVRTFTQPNPRVMMMLESAPQVSFILTWNWCVNFSAWSWMASRST